MKQLPSCCHGNIVISIEQKLSPTSHAKFSCVQFCTRAQGGVTAMGPATCAAHILAPWEGTKNCRTQSQSDMLWYLAIQTSVQSEKLKVFSPFLPIPWLCKLKSYVLYLKLYTKTSILAPLSGWILFLIWAQAAKPKLDIYFNVYFVSDL